MAISDYFTRWVEVYRTPNQEATTVAHKLVDENFADLEPVEKLARVKSTHRQFSCGKVKQ